MRRADLLLPIGLLAATAAPLAAAPSGFAGEMDAAMSNMMASMHVTSSGDPDRDFAAMMIPHHQGAIDMAVAELRHGSDPQLRRIAQEIIIDQQQEIVAMRLALDVLPPSAAVPAQRSHHEGLK